jgi:hypothetical protein
MSREAYFCLDFFGPFFIKEKRTNKDSYPGLKIGDLAFGKQLKKYYSSINSNDFYSQKSLTGQQ